MRKEIIAIATMVLFVSISCHKQDVARHEDSPVNLQSPSGLRIAASMDDLKKSAAAAIMKKYGSALDINITAVRYLPVPEGYAAIIDYRLKDGTTGNYIVAHGINYKLASGEDVYTATKKVHAICAGIGQCDCFITSVYIDAEAGIISFSCSCGTCIPLIVVTES